MYFGHVHDVDGYPAVSQFTKKDSCEQGYWNGNWQEFIDHRRIESSEVKFDINNLP